LTYFDYKDFWTKALAEVGQEPVIVSNCYDPVHDPERGWNLKLPDVDFGANTLLVLHFQDWLTYRQGRWIELDRVEQYYGDRSGQVAVIHWPHRLDRFYTGPVRLLEMNTHEMGVINDLLERMPDWYSYMTEPKTRAWQCLNGRRCGHRLRAAQALEKFPGGMLSYGDSVPLADWPYHTYRGTENDENFVRLRSIYAACQVNVVTETIYDDPVGIITEKTLLAMLARQIPVVIGYPGIVADCQDLGFDMFEDVVDISYDTMPNQDRVEAAIRLNRDLICGRIDLSGLKGRLEQQQQRMLSQHSQQRFRAACRAMFPNYQ
jgi:hypothetical protein